MKKTLLALTLGVSALTGCSDSASSTNTPAPTPQDSGLGDGSALKNKAKLSGDKEVGGRQIPKGK